MKSGSPAPGDISVGMVPTGAAVFVLGTRPEIIKVAPVIREVGPRACVVHTGQHFDDSMSGIFFDACGLPSPAVSLAVGGRSRGEQIGLAITELSNLFERCKPGVVVVQGDTNAALSGAMAANAAGVPLVHVEAGLRSWDRAMPEEHNRVLIDHLADVLCAATQGNVDNLLAEGIAGSQIVLTGNPVVRAVEDCLPSSGQQAAHLRRFGLRRNGYVLATIHRPENTDNVETLHRLVGQLVDLTRAGWPVIAPLHPRTLAAAERAQCHDALNALTVLPPANYGEFLSLLRHAALVVSDSGGVQEEVTVLKRPLLVVRRSTERPESMENFACLVGSDEDVAGRALSLLKDGPSLRGVLAGLPSPFGDRQAGRRIGKIVLNTIRDTGNTAMNPPTRRQIDTRSSNGVADGATTTCNRLPDWGTHPAAGKVTRR